MTLFNRNPVLRDGLTQMPGIAAYFKALLPSCAPSLEVLSLMGLIKPLTFCMWHLPSGWGEPRTQPWPVWVEKT